MRERKLPTIKNKKLDYINSPRSIKTKPHTVYRNSKGEVVPNVSSILAIGDSNSLIKWSNYIGLNGINYQHVMNSAANIGTLTHLMIENYFADSDEEVVNELNEKMLLCEEDELQSAKNAYEGFLLWVEEQDGLELIESEVAYVSDKYNYGGTLDWYGYLNNELILIDFKTSNNFSSKMFMQLAAYKNLLEENGNEVDKVIVLKLEKNFPGYSVKEKASEEMAVYWKLFKSNLLTKKLTELIKDEWEY